MNHTSLIASLFLVAAVGVSAPDSPVADAAQRGDMEAVRTLLREGADVNAAQGDGMTALHWSAVNGDAAMAMLVTHISAAAGAMLWMTMEWIKFGKPSALGAVTGMVAGLGTITPASGFVGPGGALVIGILAGIICFNGTLFIKRVLKIDDSLDVFPVHGIGGMLGTLLAGVFASTGLGVFSGYGFADGIEGMGGQVSVQLLGIVATVVFTAVMTFVILKVVGALVGLRVGDEQEIEGLDIVLHEERGYDLP